jgi:hypothetical protein
LSTSITTAISICCSAVTDFCYYETMATARSVIKLGAAKLDDKVFARAIVPTDFDNRRRYRSSHCLE